MNFPRVRNSNEYMPLSMTRSLTLTMPSLRTLLSRGFLLVALLIAATVWAETPLSERYQRLITGTAENPELLVSDVFAVIVLQKTKGEPRPEDTNVYKSIGAFRAERIDGLRFGILTGDMNPLHWVPPYAKMAGFKNEILHGFGTFARTWELLAQQVGKGRVGLVDVRFIRPLVLPATADVEVTEGTGERLLRVTDGKTIFAAGTFRV